MKKIVSAIFSAALVGVACFPGTAMTKSMHSTMMAQGPKCAAKDNVVGVNMSTKMYMTHMQLKNAAKGMSDAQVQAMMTKSHVKLMCQSAATKMGAKMMKNKI